MSTTQAPAPLRGPFVPLLLIGVAATIALGLQVGLQWAERQAVSERIASQSQALAEGYKLRGSADALFTGLQELADKADPDARLVVEQLRQRGLTIHAGAKTPPPPAS